LTLDVHFQYIVNYKYIKDNTIIIYMDYCDLFYKIFDFKDWYEIIKKISDPEYENELGNKYELRVWSRL